MFESSRKRQLDARLIEQVADIEAQPGYEVLGAQIYHFPATTIRVECMVIQPRKLTLFEEFILRAASELKTRITPAELSDALAVDTRFITHTMRDLTVSLGALKGTTETAPLELTPVGQQFLGTGLVPQPPISETILLAYVPPYDDLILIIEDELSPQIEPSEDAPNLNANIDEARIQALLDTVDDQLVVSVTARCGQPIQVPDEGRLLQKTVGVERAETFQSAWALMVIRDVADGCLFLRARSLQHQTIPMLHEKTLASWLELQGITVANLLGLSDDEYTQLAALTSEATADGVDERQSRAFDVERSIQRVLEEKRRPQPVGKRKGQEPNETAELIRDADIRPVFLDTLRQAKRRILIVSPWITDEAVDNEIIGILRDLADQRVVTVLGWGIKRQQGLEDKQPSSDLLRRLNVIATPEGLPGVAVLWLGNQHSKDVIIDDRVHLCGSHNWLSYRGDRLPRGESVYRVTIRKQVQQAAGYIDSLVAERAEGQWQALTDGRLGPANDLDLCRIATALVTAGQFDTAVGRGCAWATNANGTAWPLTVLTSAAGERLYGVDPAKRLRLLYSIATAATSPSLSQDAGLCGRLLHLMQKLMQQDRDGLLNLLQSTREAWEGMKMLTPEESAEDFLDRLSRI